MAGRLKLLAACFALACAALAADSSAVTTRARQTKDATVPPRALTEQERRGKELYLRGLAAKGREVVATVGEVEVPGSTMTCAGCHGARGEGKTEGGVTAGALNWAHMLKTSGHTHPSGRKHGPFDEASFARAVVGGVDPSGNELLLAMPRYRLAPEELADLVAYLKRIETDADPGVGADFVRVGTLLPSQGTSAGAGAEMRGILAAYFAEVNAGGGIHGRKIELKIGATGANAAATAASARALAEREQLFAFVGGVSATAERELAAFAAESETPFVGPATPAPYSAEPLNRQVFYLTPGVREEARTLVKFAASKPGAKGPWAVVYQEGELYEAAARAAEDQMKKLGLNSPPMSSYARGSFDAAALAGRLEQGGFKAVFFFGPEDDELALIKVALIKEAGAAGWAPELFLGSLVQVHELGLSLTPAFKDKIFFAFQNLTSDFTREGYAEFRALQTKHKLSSDHLPEQFTALAAAKVFVEALRRAGADLTRERLIAALESLYDFKTGILPRVIFGPNRRIGGPGAYVVTFDPARKDYVLAADWVKAN